MGAGHVQTPRSSPEAIWGMKERFNGSVFGKEGMKIIGTKKEHLPDTPFLPKLRLVGIVISCVKKQPRACLCIF